MTEPMLGESVVNYWRDRAQRLEVEIEALRAALATQLQPLFEGTVDDLLRTADHDIDGWDEDLRIVVYPAVAGSATPGEPEHVAGSEGWWQGVEAGSATPTEEDVPPIKVTQLMPDDIASAQEAFEASERIRPVRLPDPDNDSVAGSATPEEDTPE
jgi:hypothetical protein